MPTTRVMNDNPSNFVLCWKARMHEKWRDDLGDGPYWLDVHQAKFRRVHRDRQLLEKCLVSSRGMQAGCENDDGPRNLLGRVCSGAEPDSPRSAGPPRLVSFACIYERFQGHGPRGIRASIVVDETSESVWIRPNG